MNRPLILLIITGAFLGLNFPLGRMALAAGIAPALWAAWICLGAGVTMQVVSSLAERQGDSPRLVRYAFTSGFLSYVAPNFLTYLVIPEIGSGLAAIIFAMSPVTTALLSLTLKVRPPSPMALAGICLGLAGALVIIFARNGTFGGGAWLPVAALVPVFLGAGNVYRTLAWPNGAGPMRLASRTNLAAAPVLLAVNVALTGSIGIAPMLAHAGLCLGQIAVSTCMFVTFFRLQQIGGPTYLSQIGYVAAVVGVGIGVAWFGEVYPASVWIGAAIVAAGIALTTWAQIRSS